MTEISFWIQNFLSGTAASHFLLAVITGEVILIIEEWSFNYLKMKLKSIKSSGLFKAVSFVC